MKPIAAFRTKGNVQALLLLGTDKRRYITVTGSKTIAFDQAPANLKRRADQAHRKQDAAIYKAECEARIDELLAF
tara:strand:- start:376 stop:600 length:225 start_codon:yes stop_codon:yes gene_type:complete